MKAEDFDGKTGEYDILYCKLCNVGITSPCPTEDTVSQLYIERESNNFDSKNNTIFEKIKDYVNQFAFRKIKNELKSDPLMILDFGTGNGSVALAASRVYPSANVECVDFHNTPPERIRQSSEKIKYYSVDNFSKIETKYDLIILKNVLEHVHDPMSLLNNLKCHLAPNGIIWIEVPNLKSGVLRIFGKYSGCLVYAPYHLYHFTESSLLNILRNSGMNGNIRNGILPIPIMSNVISNILRINLNNTLRLFGAILYPFQVIIEFVYNSSTLINIVARVDGEK
jgi:2-polyprenyl-3-methyl-5-hydroxy-6-metoxy-1,4-benzoquinol methylase